MQKASTKLVSQDVVEEEKSSHYLQRFHSLVDPAGTAIAITDLKGRFNYVNQALADLLGYSVEELVERPFKDFIHPSDRGKVMRLFLKVIVLRRQPRTLEFRAINKSGKTICLWTKPTRLKINGKTIGFQAIITDVTDLKIAVEKLRQSESKYKQTSTFLNNILSTMSDYVFVVDENYNHIFLNDSAKKTYGANVGGKCYAVARKRDSPCHYSGIPCEVQEILREGKSYFENTRRSDATGKITHLRSRPILMSNGSKAALVMARDVTEEYRAKQETVEAVSLLNAIIESTADGIFVVDNNEKIMHFNQKWVRMFNVPDKFLKSRNDRELLNSLLKNIKDPENFHKRTRELFEHPDSETTDIFEWKDGRTFERHSKPHKIKGVTVGRVVSFRDITERRLMEDKIRRYTQHLEELVEEKTRDLIVSENFLKTIFENIPDHLYIKDRDSKFIFANKSYCDFRGKLKEDILGKDVYDLYPRVLADIFTSQDKQVFDRESDLHTSDIPIIDGKGVSRRIYTIKLPLKDYEGKVTHLLGITRDITKLKQAEEYLEKTFNLSVDMICIAGMDGYLKKINPAFERILGWGPEELLSKPFIELVHSEDREQVRETIHNCMSKDLETFNLQIRVLCKDASYRWLSWIGKIIKEEGIAIATARDITEEKNLEDVRNQFTSIITHEIRTPLTSINAYLTLALSSKFGIISKDLESALQVIKRNSDRLFEMSNDLLDLKRLETGNMPLKIENLELQELIENTIKEIKPLMDEKSQNLHIELPENPLMIKGDPVRLNQALTNLLSNSNKFTPKNGHITIHVKETKKSIQTRISDTGIGIKKGDLKRVFIPFANIQKPTYFKGTSLGLSVTKALIKAHGGKIKVQSEGEDKGSTFTITLPKSST
ncbi:PAS domain S-box protein [[Eubacterium] cellulosolvens]